MVDRIIADRWEYQDVLVHEVETNFGPEWVYQNESGNPAISRKVLTAFRKLHGGVIEWDRSERRWDAVSPRPS